MEPNVGVASTGSLKKHSRNAYRYGEGTATGEVRELDGRLRVVTVETRGGRSSRRSDRAAASDSWGCVRLEFQRAVSRFRRCLDAPRTCAPSRWTSRRRSARSRWARRPGWHPARSERRGVYVLSYGRLVDKEQRIEARIAALEAQATAQPADADAVGTVG